MKFPLKPGDVYVWKNKIGEMVTATATATANPMAGIYALRWDRYGGWLTEWTFMHREVTR